MIPRSNLTNSQKRLLTAIETVHAETGRMPHRRELLAAMGLVNRHAVSRPLQVLQELGFVTVAEGHVLLNGASA